MPKYIIADSEGRAAWTHIFLEPAGAAGDPVEVERSCRFVLDRKRLELVHVDVERNGKMVAATSDAMDDLLDSLINGNPSLVDDPESYGLDLSDRLPNWCRNRDSPPDVAEPQTTLFETVQLNSNLERVRMPATDLSAQRPVSGAGSEWSRELVESIAKDVGDAVAVHIETMYPAAVAACPSTFLLSVRNSTFNELMAAIKVNDAGEIVARLAERKRARRKIKSRRKMRAASPEQSNGE